MKKKNIILIGFMGTGKSTVGKIMAKRLKMGFVDTDFLIEKKSKRKIKDIFATDGEEYFREIEKTTVTEIGQTLTNRIISTGGGVVLNSENIQALRKNGVIYLLKGSRDTIVRNLSKSVKKRPLLDLENWVERVDIILSERNESYIGSADYIINIDNKSLDEISTEIIKSFSEINREGSQWR